MESSNTLSSTEELLIDVIVGVVVALVVLALLTTANIGSQLGVRVLIAAVVGIIFTASILTSKSVKKRNQESIEQRATNARTHSGKELQPHKNEEQERAEEKQEDEEQEQGEEKDEEQEQGEEQEEDEEDEEDEEEEQDEAELAETEEQEADEKDQKDVLNSRANPLAGYSRINAKARLLARRRIRAAADYLGDKKQEKEELDEDGEFKIRTRSGLQFLDELLTYEGLRKIEDSTLYAKEAYKTHQYDEPGEGMDQRYVDPSLMTYDSQFAAYGDAYILNPRILSNNTPMAF